MTSFSCRAIRSIGAPGMPPKTPISAQSGIACRRIGGQSWSVGTYTGGCVSLPAGVGVGASPGYCVCRIASSVSGAAGGGGGPGSKASHATSDLR